MHRIRGVREHQLEPLASARWITLTMDIAAEARTSGPSCAVPLVADGLGSRLYRWRARAALADAIPPLGGVNAADVCMAEGAAIIREVVAGSLPTAEPCT